MRDRPSHDDCIMRRDPPASLQPRPAAQFGHAVFNDRARHGTMRASFPANSPVAIPDTTMPEAYLLQACLDELDGVDDFLDRRELAEEHAPVLLGRTGIASMLAARIARTADSERNAPLDLFGVLVERAQRDAENRRRFGEPFLAEARGAIDTLAARGNLPDHAALGLARAFIRAGLEAPECLFPIFAGEPGTGQALAAFPGLLDREIDRLARHAGGDDHLLHDLLANLMAVLPSEFRPTFVHHVSGREEERYGRAALYWLLDRSPEVRLAAASGLSGRVRGDAMEPALPALVPLIPNWMPADSARPLLDSALREARLRGRFHPMARPAGRPTRFLAALPAGSGMQHLAAALDPADGPACAVVVVKAGHGVTIVHIFRERLIFRVEATKTGVPLELPVTRQLAALLERRWEDSGSLPEGWVFPSTITGMGHIRNLAQHYKPIGEAGGAKFWYHGLRNAFITIAERDLMLPHALTKRLVNHAPPNDVTEGYAADWTIGQLRDPAQRIADRIEALMMNEHATTTETSS